MTQSDPTAIIDTAQSQSRQLLTEVESKALLRAAGLDVVRTELASSRDQAVGLAEELGWPVALRSAPRILSTRVISAGCGSISARPRPLARRLTPS